MRVASPPQPFWRDKYFVLLGSTIALAAVSAVVWQWSKLYIAAGAIAPSVPSSRTIEVLKDSVEQRNELLRTFFQLIGGLIIGVSLLSAWSSYRLSREGQLTDRFSHAIDQLGERGNVVKQLGGVYALERIARDSPRDHWPIMEILAAFIRENSHQLDNRSIVQSAIRTIGRRNRSHEVITQGSLDLSGADLSHLDLQQLNLANSDMRGACLDGARLRGADLSGSDLTRASLRSAELPEAVLTTAQMNECGLQNALLHRANLRGAALRHADLTEASLASANLSDASLDGAILARAILSDANFTNTTGSEIIAAGARMRDKLLPEGMIDANKLRELR